ncbi:hypothetical protein DYBT9275_01948 [Dyadobacter sp. CECT 9275]|uniref:Uncharacterized protein n=1 Tax=Dyadobacter helix TaxID=2822344 RepID=A0A916JBM3_9BACT|nr:hypothetical protein [Dyadobacter sp. CECT 9275]CAG4998186.1 hypothetical protein DYBT9275_01948 [Dyadobacter sp. CECT 9275]
MKTQEFEIREDIRVMCVSADSFPGGIADAYSGLEKVLTGKMSLPADGWREHLEAYEVYGMAKMEQGKMVYKACAGERFPGEGQSTRLPMDVIPAGKYLCVSLLNWQEKKASIAAIFDQLFASPEASKTVGICVEYYKSPEEVLLMVRQG